MTDEFNKPKSKLEQEIRDLATKHDGARIFYVIQDDSHTGLIVGSNGCMKCLKPILEEVLEQIPYHTEDELKTTKH